MSTRAIIAMPTAKGYVTAWCWNDGGPNNLGRELRTYFRDEESVKGLIRTKSFSGIFGPRVINDFVRDGDTAICLPNERWLLVHPHQGGVVAGKGKGAFFKSIEDMLQCDLNYVYVFADGKWETHK